MTGTDSSRNTATSLSSHGFSHEHRLAPLLCCAVLLGMAAFQAHAATTPTERVLYNFSGPDGSSPNTILQSATGKRFGTANAGGANDLGTVFELTRDGSLTTLHDFAGTDGANPTAFIAGPNGTFYGATAAGGTYDQGTLFTITAAGAFQVVYSFQGTDGTAPNSLMVANGMIYGTTSAGGASGDGVIFTLDANNVLNVLYQFSGPDGALPGGALIQASDGQLYGETSGGGSDGSGTVFRISPAGALTTLVADASSIGSEPVGALVQGKNGDFYGVTTASFGSIYKMTAAGATTVLYVFNAGLHPGDAAGFQAGLVQDGEGNLYGANTFGGEFAFGGLFRITPKGVLTHLHAFMPGGDGTSFGPLQLAPNGRLLGSGQVGGSNGDGVVESFSRKPIPPTLTFTANPASLSLSQRDTTTLQWIPTDADTCVAGGSWSGNQTTAILDSTTITFTAPGTYVYNLDCSGGGGSITSSVTVSVTD